MHTTLHNKMIFCNSLDIQLTFVTNSSLYSPRSFVPIVIIERAGTDSKNSLFAIFGGQLIDMCTISPNKVILLLDFGIITVIIVFHSHLIIGRIGTDSKRPLLRVLGDFGYEQADVSTITSEKMIFFAQHLMTPSELGTFIILVMIFRALGIKSEEAYKSSPYSCFPYTRTGMHLTTREKMLSYNTFDILGWKCSLILRRVSIKPQQKHFFRKSSGARTYD